MFASDTEADENPYAPPATAAEDVTEPQLPQAQALYYPVGLTKFLLLSLTTFSIFDIYWAYKNWVYVSNSRNQKMMPFVRAFFLGFTSFSLFASIKKDAEGAGVKVWIPGAFLGICFFILNGAHRLPDPYWLVTLASPIALLPARNAIEAMNKKHTGEALLNRKINGWQILLIVAGGILTLLGIVGTFFPEE